MNGEIGFSQTSSVSFNYQFQQGANASRQSSQPGPRRRCRFQPKISSGLKESSSQEVIILSDDSDSSGSESNSQSSDNRSTTTDDTIYNIEDDVEYGSEVPNQGVFNASLLKKENVPFRPKPTSGDQCQLDQNLRGFDFHAETHIDYPSQITIEDLNKSLSVETPVPAGYVSQSSIQTSSARSQWSGASQKLRQSQTQPQPRNQTQQTQSTTGICASRFARRRSCTLGNQSQTPCKLRRDTDSSDCFVKLLILFAAKLISTVWPLSACPPMMSTSFNGAAVLPLTIFIQETLRRSKTSYSTLQVALYYIILLKDKLPVGDFTREQQPDGCRAMQCGRRMFLAALMLASKYLQDRNYSTRAWSKISGLRSAEINENEREYLNRISYNLHMPKEAFENWNQIVLTLSRLSNRQAPQCKDAENLWSENQGSGDATSIWHSKIAENNNQANEEPSMFSETWWTALIRDMQPEIVKDSAKSLEFLQKHNLVDAALDESFKSMPLASMLQDTQASHTRDADFTSRQIGEISSSNQPSPVAGIIPSPGQAVGSLPVRPQLRNLPTPQSTPRHNSNLAYGAPCKPPALRCSASASILSDLRRQTFNNASLERCPPPTQLRCPSLPPVSKLTKPAVPSRMHTVPVPQTFVSSPASTCSESNSNTTRSRSSSISSNSSWSSILSMCQLTAQRSEICVQSFSSPMQYATGRDIVAPPSRSICPSLRSTLTSQPLMSAATNNNGTNAQVSFSGVLQGTFGKQVSKMPAANEFVDEGYESYEKVSPFALEKLFLNQCEENAAQALLGLKTVQSRSNMQVTESDESLRRVSSEPHRAHKRTISRVNEPLHAHVRSELKNETKSDEVLEDSFRSSYCHAQAKQVQTPSSEWARAKIPMPSITQQNKRIALQSSCQNDMRSAELAGWYLIDNITADIM